MKNLLIIFFCFLHSLHTFAHQDTPIKLEKDGSLRGLPEQYSDSYFDRTTFTLTIGENKIVIPECILFFLNDNKNYNIRFSASWYHDAEVLPHYIHMDIEKEHESSTYQVFFNLETLEIFQIGKIGYKIDKLEISKECQIEISNSISKK